MKTNEVADLYRKLIDEPDSTFIDSSDVALHLRVGYDEFRNFVTELYPDAYARTIDIQLPSTLTGNVVSYDLTQGGLTPTLVNQPSLLGATPNILGTPTPRLERLMFVELVGTVGGANAYTIPQANSYAALEHGGGVLLRGAQLLFDRGMAGKIARLHYIPDQGIGLTTIPMNYEPSWTTAITFAGSQYIDDFNAYHDLIALMAYDQYGIQDLSDNPVLSRRYARRQQAFADYLQRRQTSGSQYVQEEW